MLHGCYVAATILYATELGGIDIWNSVLFSLALFPFGCHTCTRSVRPNANAITSTKTDVTHLLNYYLTLSHFHYTIVSATLWLFSC